MPTPTSPLNSRIRTREESVLDGVIRNLKVTDCGYNDMLDSWYCDYQYRDAMMHFRPSNEELACELERQDYIDHYHLVDGGIVLVFLSEGGTTTEELNDFMRMFSEDDWRNLMVTYEYNQIIPS